MRLLLADSAIAAPGQLLPNPVVPTGGTETALTTPSGRQTGVKLRIDIDVRIDVAADKLADFVIDFQVCKSLVAAGGADSVGRYLLEPVLGVTPHCVSGVKGSVDASTASGANTLVTLQQRGTTTTAPVVVKGTAPDSSGHFVLAPVTPGAYDLVVTSNGHATAVVTSVIVATDTVTAVGSALMPPVSATDTIGGTVVTPVSTTTGGIDASASVTQTLATGGTIAPVNSSSGASAFAVPVGAVSVAPYGAGALTFGPDTTKADKFAVWRPPPGA